MHSSPVAAEGLDRVGRDVPPLGDVVGERRGEIALVNASRHPVDLARLGKLPHFFSIGRAPGAHGLVRASREQGLPVGAKSHGHHGAFVANERADLLGSRDIPEARGLVVASGEELGAVEPDRERQDVPLVAFERLRHLSLAQAPELDGSTFPRGRDHVAVEEGEAADDAPLVELLFGWSRGGHLPHVKALVLAAPCNKGPVRAKGHGQDRPAGALELRQIDLRGLHLGGRGLGLEDAREDRGKDEVGAIGAAVVPLNGDDMAPSRELGQLRGEVHVDGRRLDR